VQKKQRMARLDAVKSDTRTLIFYEAPHKLHATLADLLAALGDRSISLCRELTKMYEEVRRMTLSEAVTYYKTNEPRGEFVLIVAGAAENEQKQLTLADAAALAESLVSDGMRAADACKQIAKETGFSKSELYAALLTGREEGGAD